MRDSKKSQQTQTEQSSCHRESQKHSQEWLCHPNRRPFVASLDAVRACSILTGA